MLIDFTLGQTSIVLRVKLRNNTSSWGAGLTALTNSSSGLVIAAIADNEATTTSYTGGSTIQTIATLGTFAAPSASNCRFKELDSTKHPGIYEIQLDNTRYAVSNAKSITISINGATNLAEFDCMIPLRSVNPYDGVHFGLTSLPNAAAGASNGLPLSVDGSGRVDVLKINGTSQTARDLGASVLLSPGTGTGQVSLTSGAVTVGTNNDKTGYTASTVSDKTGYSLASSQTFSTTGSVGSVVGNIGGITGVTLPSTVASPTNITAGTITTVTNLTNAPTSGDLTTTMKTSITSAVPTAAANATAVWQDTTTGDFTVSGSIGKTLASSFTALGTSVFTTAALANAPITGVTLAASQTFSTTGSVGAVSGAVGSVTGNVGGNVTGSVGSVAGAVASVTGNVGGNLVGNVNGNVAGSVASVTGSVASVTGSVGSVTGAVGSVTGAVGSVTAAVVIDQTQTVTPTNQDSKTTITIADAFLGAWTEPFAKESISGTSYVKKQPNGTSNVRTFTLDSGTNPTQRT